MTKYFDMVSMIISLFIIINNLKYRKTPLPHNNILFKVLLCNFISSAASIVEEYLCYIKFNNETIIVGFSSIYFASHVFAAYLVLDYVRYHYENVKKTNVIIKMVLGIPIIFLEVIVFLNPFTRFISDINNFTYQRSSGIFLLYAVFGLYLLCAFILLLYFKDRFIKKKFIMILMIFASMLFAVFVQYKIPEAKIECCILSISILVLYITVENPQELYVKTLQTFNFKSFAYVMESVFLSKQKVNLVIITIKDYIEILSVFGYANVIEITKDVIEYIRSIDNSIMIFYIELDSFCLVVDDTKDRNIDKLVEQIADRFSKAWVLKDKYYVGPKKSDTAVLSDLIGANKTLCMIKQCIISCPGDVNSFEEIMGIVPYLRHYETNKSVLLLSDIDLTKYRRTIQINEAASNVENTYPVEMMFVPLYSTDKGRITLASVSYRIYDDKLGYLYNDEYIEYISRINHDIDIYEKIIQNVIQLFESLEASGKAIDKIIIPLYNIVNLDSEEYVNMYIREKSIESKYKDKIVFEAEETVINMIEKNYYKEDSMFSEDINLSVCNFGTGYTDIASIYKKNIKFIRIDSQLSKQARYDDKVRIIIESIINLLHDIGIKTIVDEIDNEEDFNFMIGLKCDYLCGSYVSGDVDSDMMIALAGEQPILQM